MFLLSAACGRISFQTNPVDDAGDDAASPDADGNGFKTPWLTTGSYVGTGASGVTHQVGFQPDVLFVFSTGAHLPVMRTATMSGGTKSFSSNPASLEEGMITAVQPSGFELGTHQNVNAQDVRYHWLAMRTVEGNLSVGSYNADDRAGRHIEVGFEPQYVIVTAEASASPAHAFSPASQSFAFLEAVPRTDEILGFDANGFIVGNSARVNRSGNGPYHYVAFALRHPGVSVGQYVGDNVQDRRVPVRPDQPACIIVRGEADLLSVAWLDSIEDSTTLGFYSIPPIADAIEMVSGGQMQLGQDSRVNAAGTTYRFVAFSR